MTKNTKPKPALAILRAVTLRLAQEDIALLDKMADALMLPGEEKNRSRAARVLFDRVRTQERSKR